MALVVARSALLTLISVGSLSVGKHGPWEGSSGHWAGPNAIVASW